jgi:hypothetical protein
MMFTASTVGVILIPIGFGSALVHMYQFKCQCTLCTKPCRKIKKQELLAPPPLHSWTGFGMHSPISYAYHLSFQPSHRIKQNLLTDLLREQLCCTQKFDIVSFWIRMWGLVFNKFDHFPAFFAVMSTTGSTRIGLPHQGV